MNKTHQNGSIYCIYFAVGRYVVSQVFFEMGQFHSFSIAMFNYQRATAKTQDNHRKLCKFTIITKWMFRARTIIEANGGFANMPCLPEGCQYHDI